MGPLRAPSTAPTALARSAPFSCPPNVVRGLQPAGLASRSRTQHRCFSQSNGQDRPTGCSPLPVQGQQQAVAGCPDSGASRRLLLSGAAALAAGLFAQDLPAFADEGSIAAVVAPAETDVEVTHKVYLDIGIADSALKKPGERTIGDKTIIPDAAPVGRIVLGLYGKVAPGTVANFLAVVGEGLLDGTIFSRVLPGEYLVAGRQGARRQGELETPKSMALPANPDLLESGAFRLRHSRPGTLSLNLSDNDEDPQVKGRPNYRPLEFLITTGPGPVPKLDGANIVFGRVLEGFNIINTITAVPTFQPSDRSRAFNMFAGALGDERAEAVRRKYGRPLKAVVIQHAGLL